MMTFRAMKNLKPGGIDHELMRVPPYQAIAERIPISGGHPEQMRETLRRIGQAIRNASVYPPIRNYAAALATKAPPKDFLAQLKEIYTDFIKRWRYVKDPASREMLTFSPEAIWRLTIGGDGIGVGLGRGAGDCDCVTAALGAMLEAIGFKTRIATTADRKARPGRLFGHVFIQAAVPNMGWVTVDPVLHPKRPFGSTTPHARMAWWDLDGNLLGYEGNYTGLSGEQGGKEMRYGPNIEDWQDYGLSGAAEDDGQEPVEWSMLGLNDWGYLNTPQGKISTTQMYGIIDGCNLQGLMAEVDDNDDWGGGYVRTPMLELALDDYSYVNKNGAPYDGMMALGDTGEIYAYDGSLGFFKKLFRKAKGAVKKLRGRIKGGIKKLLKRTRFGRFILKVGGKLHKLAMKVVRPLTKFVGKYAAKLAPIAAMIPGYGPAIAAGLMVAGKIAKTMQKYGVMTAGKKGKVRRLSFKNPKKMKPFKRALKKEAKRMARLKKRDPAKFRRLTSKLAPKPPRPSDPYMR